MPALTQAARDYDKAYEQMKYNQAMKSGLELEKLQLDLAKARNEQEMESPSGRATRAAEVAAFLEQEQQKEVGIPIGQEMGARMTAAGGPSILEATKMQGELDVEARIRDAKQRSMENYLAGEKSLMPTASVDVGGVRQTVLAPQAGKTTDRKSVV